MDRTQMTANLPPLPKIEGDVDLVLDVYTHSSLRMGAPQNAEYGDTDRLAELGAKILELAITFHYYSRKPMLSAQEIADNSKNAISEEKLEYWLDTYGLRNRLRFAPGEKESIGKPQEIRRFFNTYIGALHIRNGMATIQEWVSRLIDPDAEPSTPFPGSVFSMNSGQQNWSSSSFSQPPSSPPPLPPINSSQATSVPNLVSLALVNQTAVQRGVAVTYSAEQVGPPHLPTWTVRCLMNGIEQGRGTGKSQKQAKEEAARQAWSRMNW